VYASLFGSGGGRASVDRRHQWVQAVFAHEPRAYRSSYAPPRETTVRVAPIVQAGVGRVRVRRAGGERALYADVTGAQAVTVSLAITSQGPAIARRIVAGVSGSRRLKLVIPASTKAGPGRLRVHFRNDAGTVKVVTRAIQIPRP
jgi:hypothetical protein